MFCPSLHENLKHPKFVTLNGLAKSETAKRKTCILQFLKKYDFMKLLLFVDGKCTPERTYLIHSQTQNVHFVVFVKKKTCYEFVVVFEEKCTPERTYLIRLAGLDFTALVARVLSISPTKTLKI